MLRYWLAGVGVQPDEDVEIVTAASPLSADAQAADRGVDLSRSAIPAVVIDYIEHAEPASILTAAGHTVQRPALVCS